MSLAKRRLGRTGFMVTTIGLGGAWLGRVADGWSEERAVAAVVRALELGINLIDTSAGYGPSEGFIGAGLAEWYRRGGKREDVILCTKTGTRSRPKDYSREGTLRSVEESLHLLRTDYLDILLVHDPDNLEEVLAPGAAWDTLQELKRQGVIRAMGLGARPHAFHRRLMETGEMDVALTFADYNLLSQTAIQGVLEPAAAHDVGVMNAMVSLYGLVGGRDPLEVAKERFGWSDDPEAKPHPRIAAYLPIAQAMWRWANEHQVSLLALALQYSLRDPRVATILMGASHAQRIEEDVAALQTPIAPEIWAEFLHAFNLPDPVCVSLT